MELLFKHIWILFIVVTVINGLVLRHRSQQYIAKKPELKPGYDSYFKHWMIFGNIPWIIIGIGNISGLTNSLLDYFNPKAMNPLVLLVHAYVVMLWIWSIWWIYAKNGAEFMERHPGLLRKRSRNGYTDATAKQLKLFFPLLLLAGIAGMAITWLVDLTPP